MAPKPRSRKARIAALCAQFVAQGQGMAEIVRRVACEEQVNLRVAWRLAHGLSQQQVADQYNALFPPRADAALITAKQVSYWETWPQSGREPSLTTLGRLARVYGSTITGLIADYQSPADAARPTEAISAQALSTGPQQAGQSAGPSLSTDDGTVGILAAVPELHPLGEFAERFVEIPVHLVRFGDPGGDDPTKRRDFGKAAALALIPLPGRAALDETTAPTLTAITGAQRRLEATASARKLARGATAHAGIANRLLGRASQAPYTADIAAAASEAAGFAAWLHADMYDIGTARAYYRMAIDLARRAGQELLAGYMLGSLAAFEIDSGDPEFGLTLIAGARKQISGTYHPAPQAWLDAISALGLATARRDGNAAADALARATKTIDRDRCPEPPPWPWVFPFDQAKLAGYRALVAVRLARPADALAAFAESQSARRPAPKQRAILMLEVATATRQDGTATRDRDRIDGAFRLACEALGVGATYSSERVIERARRFRREYSGPRTSYVREFDDQLRTAVV